MDERMTLEQVIALLNKYDRMDDSGIYGRMADSIHAHLTQPAQSVDVAKVREVIAHLRSFRSNTPPTWAHLDDAADKLAAALQEGEE